MKWGARLMDDGTGIFDRLTLEVNFTTDLGGGIHRVFFVTGDLATNVSVGQSVYFTSNVGQWEDGAGTSAKPWASNLLMIREYNTKIKIPQGYYTQEQLGATINDVLHYKTSKYTKTLGETMMDIVMNGQDLQSEPNNGATGAGENVRLWWDYAFQADTSDYKDRHYVNNVLLNTDTGGIPDNAPDAVQNNRLDMKYVGNLIIKIL